MRHSLYKSQKVRFGSFEFNFRSGELSRGGQRLKLQGQPIQILSILLERQGDLVTREELQKELWPADTFVDFEHSINAAIKRLRQALNDSSEQPQFVETLARRGYRFIAPVEIENQETEPHSFRLPPIRSLAVLPFENDPETDYLSEEITESIINKLSHQMASRVMSRSTVFRYKNQSLDPLLIGRKLNVEAVLWGKIQLRQGLLFITTELVDVTTGWQLWGEQYHGELSNAMTMQIEIARNISEQLRLRSNGEHENPPIKSIFEHEETKNLIDLDSPLIIP